MWILPTLNRPEQCAAVLRRIQETKPESTGVLFMNGGDLDSYRAATENWAALPDTWILFHNVENLGALGALNKMFELYPNEKFYGFIGDDEFLLPETPAGWDNRLIAAAGDWEFSHGVDTLHHGRRAQGYLCIGGKLARAVEYVAIPECWHNYGLDDMWEQLAKAGACRNVLVPEVRVEHRHPMAGKTETDLCYELGNSQHRIDQQVFFYWLRHSMEGVVDRVREAKA